MTTLKRIGVLVDFETRSPIDLKARGSSVYARDKRTEVMLLGAIDVFDDPVTGHYSVDLSTKRLWDFESGEDIRDYWVARDEILFAYNAGFEYQIAKYVLNLPIEIEQLYCIALQGLYNGLPGKLEDVSKAVPLKSPKDEAGHRLMLRMCSLRPDGTYLFDAEKFERLKEYCLVDIDAEAELLSNTRRVPSAELACYHETMEINDAGIPLDMELVKSANLIVEEVTNDIASKFPGVNLKSHAQIKAFAKSHGFIMASTDKEHVANYLADPKLPAPLRELLDAKALGIGSSSVSKFDAMLNYTDDDGTLRYAYRHHGAIRTGRWTSGGVQIQNLPRGEKYIISPDKQGRWLLPDVRDMIKANDFDGLYMATGGRPMDALKSVVRSCFAPPEGYKFVQRDLSAIEARGMLWVAQAEGLKLFTDFDNGDGEEPYMIFANKLGADRFMGKQGVLSSNYGIGPTTLMMLCAKQGRVITETEAVATLDLHKEMFPEVKQFWYAVGDAAKFAIKNPGSVYSVLTPTDPVKFVLKDGNLLLKLPSGRVLTYWGASLEPGKFGMEITYMTHGSENGKQMGWHRTRTWGGGITGHIVQGFSACIMRDILINMRRAGIPSVMTTHDEAVTIARDADTQGVFEKLGAIMKQSPLWAKGLPIQSAGWIEPFFIKD